MNRNEFLIKVISKRASLIQSLKLIRGTKALHLANKIIVDLRNKLSERLKLSNSQWDEYSVNIIDRINS